MHILITGAPGAGKSTLINRVVEELRLPVSGFRTRKEPAAEGETGCPVLLCPIGEGPRPVGYSDKRVISVFPEVFDGYAPRLRQCAGEGKLLLMDELGTMESRSQEFCTAVLELLDGDTPVIAAVKGKDTPFLNAVRSHPGARLFHLTEENREALFPEVLAFAGAQLFGEKL